jgi:hypothetical protein
MHVGLREVNGSLALRSNRDARKSEVNIFGFNRRKQIAESIDADELDFPSFSRSDLSDQFDIETFEGSVVVARNKRVGLVDGDLDCIASRIRLGP